MRRYAGFPLARALKNVLLTFLLKLVCALRMWVRVTLSERDEQIGPQKAT